MVRHIVLGLLLAAGAVFAAWWFVRGKFANDPSEHPLTLELKRLRAEATRLHALVSDGIQSLTVSQAKTIDTRRRIDAHIEGLHERAEKHRSALRQKEQLIGRFSILLASDEGVVLVDDRFIPPDDVRRQYEFELDQANSLRQRLASDERSRERAERVRTSIEEQYESSRTNLVKLREAEVWLREQLSQLELMTQLMVEHSAAATIGDAEVHRIQDDIAAIQFRINVYLRELPHWLEQPGSEAS